MTKKPDLRHENSGRYPFTEAGAGCRQNLIKARLEAGMSQDEVAAQIGCCQEQYSLIESNKRDGKRYWSALETLFSIPAEELMETCNDEPDWKSYFMKKFNEVK